MRHQVNLAEAGHVHIPRIGLQRDVAFQQRPRLGAAIELAPLLALLLAQEVIDAARAC
jgi:hypothetical protein